MNDVDEVIDMVQKIRPHLRGHAPEIQGAALADLAATWLAGHCVPGEPERTAELREQLLAEHVVHLRILIEVNARTMDLK